MGAGLKGAMKVRLVALAVGLAAVALAMPAGAQQAAASGPFIVFFDWAKPEINRDAAAILDKVAEAYRRQPGARLGVTGHSDRSGGAAHNLRASRIRAEAVRDLLAGRGIPRAAMSVRAYGETWPIVPTEDGVREVQNRRVEIRFVAAR